MSRGRDGLGPKCPVTEPATFVQRLPNVFQRVSLDGVWNTLGSRCTNAAGSLGILTSAFRSW